MRILHIAPYASVRVYKQVLAQQQAGWDVTLMASTTGHPDLHGMVVKSCAIPSLQMLPELDYDCCVVHTSIDTANVAERIPQLLVGCKRLVWDCHDLTDVRPVEHYDAVVVPSQGYKRILGDIGKPVEVVYSKVCKGLWPEWPETRVYACVLAATMSTQVAWADYRSVPDRIKMPLFIHPSNVPIDPAFRHMNILQKLPYPEMLRSMTQFSHGFAGAANASNPVHDIVTNKCLEYIACGCKLITYGADEMTSLTGSLWHMSREECMRLYSMEAELPKLEAVYNG